jgi:hypothetical protein
MTDYLALTKERVWDLSDGEMFPLWRNAARRIVEQAGTDEPQAVVDWYAGRFGLGPLRLIDIREARGVISGLPSNGRRPGEISTTLMMAVRTRNADTGATGYWITWNPRAAWREPGQMLVVLRHEIEHVRDMVEGYPGGPDDPVVYDRATREVTVLPGHHRRWTLFDWEWPHVVLIKRALAEGREVPPEVLEGYGLAAPAAPRP